MSDGHQILRMKDGTQLILDPNTGKYYRPSTNNQLGRKDGCEINYYEKSFFHNYLSVANQVRIATMPRIVQAKVFFK